MLSLTSPYGATCVQNSGVSPRRSSGVSAPAHAGFDEPVLHEQGVDVGDGGLEHVQAGDAEFLPVAAVGGDVAALAVEASR